MKFVAAILSLFVVAALATSINSSAQEEQPDAKDPHRGTFTEFDVPGANPAAGLGTQAFANNVTLGKSSACTPTSTSCRTVSSARPMGKSPHSMLPARVWGPAWIRAPSPTASTTSA